MIPDGTGADAAGGAGRDGLFAKLLPEEILEIARRRRTSGVEPTHGLEEETRAALEAEDAREEARRRSEEVRAGLSLSGRLLGLMRPAPTLKAAAAEERQAGKVLEEARARLAKRLGSSSPRGLVGLALSGGGIRSATFNLGVLQALAAAGILRRVDYLSTVSGGGFIGGCLSSLLNDPAAGSDPDRFPFRHIRGEVEPDPVKHLRSSGRYLAPQGFLDFLTGAGHLFRGIVAHFIVMFPYVVLAVGLTIALCGDARFCRPFTWSTWYHATRLCLPLLLLWFALFPLLHLLLRRSRRWQKGYDRALGLSLLLLPAIFAAESLPLLISRYQSLLAKRIDLASGWASVLGLLLPFLLSGKAAAAVHRLPGRVVLYGLGLLGPLILLLIYLNLGVWAIYGQAPGILRGVDFGYVYLAAAAAFVYAWLFFDMNVTSMHRYYRDRLSEAYLFKDARDPGTGRLLDNDAQKISRLNAPGSTAPYHLINAALNLQGSTNPDYRGRKADFFLFTKRFVGSRCTGYAPTTALEAADPHLDLGTAMAISGAATAPNTGTSTIKPLVFVMALLNIRLGYWLPHPRRIARGLRDPVASFLKVGPVYLFAELLGLIDENGPRVNLSDGGHIENLGIYELLRRRCELIIASDAEEDPDLAFGGLVNLIRTARIDRGIDIEIDLDALRATRSGLAGKHCALGRIDYGDGREGRLLYLKSSLTGDEEEDVRAYRASHPKFPQEPTSDQFFDEAQFEVYRALGHHIARGACAGYAGGDLAGWVRGLEKAP